MDRSQYRFLLRDASLHDSSALINNQAPGEDRSIPMAENSPIEWTDATWNPVAGCSLASAGCTNCYAMRMAARLEAMGVEKYVDLTRKSGGRAKWTGRVRCDERSLAIPRRWKKPRKVFVNSMSDLFHAELASALVV
ncbi:DUF5131 family protein [Sphingopyxis terrae]|uniref:DUF5131 family protein n=1 Tax=Sphingopyxis terrae TaxID=33052 RepID=UPI002ADD381A|nr:DUF5131 family protein [Sphingopyxis terrae]